MSKIIAIVEDDQDQLRNTMDALRQHHYEVQGYTRREDALRAFAAGLPDLAILDVILGDDIDGGFTLCRELKARNPDLPIIFLSSRTDDIDRISGLRLGACDYQTKPVSLAYLIERVNAHFRLLEGQGGAHTQPVQLGSLTIDEARLAIRWKGRPVPLTYTEFNLVKALCDHIGTRGASYDLLSQATRQGVVENNTINTHILNLRRKFRAVDPGFDGIRNVHGYGYRWAGD